MTHVKVHGAIVGRRASSSHIVNQAMFRLWAESSVELRSLYYSTEWSIIQCLALECLVECLIQVINGISLGYLESTHTWGHTLKFWWSCTL